MISISELARKYGAIVSVVALLIMALAGCAPTPGKVSSGTTALATPEVAPLSTTVVVPTLTVSWKSKMAAPPTPTLYIQPTPIPVRTFPPSPCAPPCWQGITTGKTKVVEAVSIGFPNGD